MGRGQDALDCFEHMQANGMFPDAVTFASVLKACGSVQAAELGEQIHDEIIRQGLLRTDVVLGNALIDMYAKCGALGKAEQVLDNLPFSDVVSWSTLITGYVQEEQPEKALECFTKMKREGLFPDAVTFVCILKACAQTGAVEEGEKIHNEIARRGLVEKSIILCNALVDMYAKCGAFIKAERVLMELPLTSVVAWNSLITGYIEQDQPEQSIICFGRMQQKGIAPNVVTFVCALKACGMMRAADMGEQIHDEIITQGLLINNIVLGNAIVDMYAKCGALSKAAEVFDTLLIRNVVTWSALIAGYAQQGQGQQALNCYEEMQQEGLSPNYITFLNILKACGSIPDVGRGKQVHDEIIEQGLTDDVAIGTALVDMYAKCGALSKAQEVLERLPSQNIISWNALIVGYLQQGKAEQALNCYKLIELRGLPPDSVTFGGILKACGSLGTLELGEQVHQDISRQGLLRTDIILGNMLVDMYARCGALRKAQKVLEEIPVRDVVSWSTLIQGYTDHGQAEQAIICFDKMQQDGVSANEVTFLCILKACGRIGAAERGEQIHEEISRQGMLENNVVLATALVDLYAKCGAIEKAYRMLEKYQAHNVVSWTSLMSGYVQSGQAEQAISCFHQMKCRGLSPDPVTYVYILKACSSIGDVNKGEEIHNEVLEKGFLTGEILLINSLVDMYAKCGALGKAQQVFEGLSVRDAVTWSALLAGYAQHGQADRAVWCFEQMQDEGHSPDSTTFASMLKVCGSMGAVNKGQQIHVEISRRSLLDRNPVLCNALVDMYVKCGALTEAEHVHQELPIKNVTSWNSLIAGYTCHGQIEDAFAYIKQMLNAGLSPDNVTMVNILKAWGISGSAERAQFSFEDMSRCRCIEPEFVHYTSMVDAFGRVGQLSKAIGVIQKMPESCNSLAIWLAFLSACCKWGDVSSGRWAFEQAVEVDRNDATAYVLMANIYAAAGMHEDAKIIAKLRAAKTACKLLELG
ncbi:hypothetical protein KP509_18G001000 [Ceratopteris richardii]|nr:hypothetical protein KP509_18G001000 [Ceratopteris richardii]